MPSQSGYDHPAGPMRTRAAGDFCPIFVFCSPSVYLLCRLESIEIAMLLGSLGRLGPRRASGAALPVSQWAAAIRAAGAFPNAPGIHGATDDDPPKTKGDT